MRFGPAAGEAELTVLFADLAGSTQLYDRYGDSSGRDMVAAAIAVLTAATRRNGGTPVRVIGDEIMATFGSADSALMAAAEMQDAIAATLTPDRRRLAIRVGLHSGHVLFDEAELYGDAVNVASRIAAQAKASQILTTAATVAAVSGALRESCRLIDRVPVKGKREPIDVFEMIWKAADATLMPHGPVTGAGAGDGASLVLTAASGRAVADGEHPTLTIGRAEQNDLVVAEHIVSRLHARAECRHGRFTLIDQSANGTFVVPDAGAPAFIRRDTYVLTGSGRLGLGEAPVAGSATALRYDVRGSD